LFTRRRTDTDGYATGHAAWCLAKVGSDVGAHLFDFALATWCAQHYDDLRVAEQHLIRCGRVADAAMLTAGIALDMHCDAGSRAATVLARVDAHLARIDDAALAARLHFTGVMAAMAARAPDAIADHGRSAVAAAQASGDPMLRAVALVLSSWSTVLADPAQALTMVEEARQLAIAAGDQRARDHASSYRVFHLAMQRRYDEAVAQATDVIARSPSLDEGGQASFVAIVALSACTAVSDPSIARSWIDELLSRPSPTNTMWGNEVLVAALHASEGDAVEASALAMKVRRRLQQAGRDCYPDLLIPAAILAHRLGEDDRAARWVRAVRDAGVPTQSFQTTCLYRRIREVVGMAEASSPRSLTLEAIGDEALAWMDAAAHRQTISR
jgi:hypothetical protein